MSSATQTSKSSSSKSTVSKAPKEILSGETFNAEKDTKYSKPKVNASGGKSVGILNVTTNGATYVSTPLMMTWGVSEFADKKTGALRSDAGEIVSVIDGIKARLAKEDTKFIKGKLRDVRELLVDTVPGYRVAQEKFAEKSKPINIMQVGQYLEGKLKPVIETPAGERAGIFSQALKEAPTTIKQSTGQSRFTELSQILSPDQVKVVEGIRKDRSRAR